MMIFTPELPATLILLALAYLAFGIGGVVGVCIAAFLLRLMR